MKATQEEYYYIFILICHTINRFQREVYFLGNQLGSHHEGSGGKSRRQISTVNGQKSTPIDQ